MKARKGFTLVEILIVVVILGILAAIVIPQFTDASTQSKLSSCRTTLQSMRSQIELYKIQHNDDAPALDEFATQMTTKTNSLGAAPGQDEQAFGPYMQRVPKNPWNDSDTLAVADAAGIGWVYDEDTGAIWIGIADVTNADVVTKLQESGDAQQ
jgi:general secretion pathway protein G